MERDGKTMLRANMATLSIWLPKTKVIQRARFVHGLIRSCLPLLLLFTHKNLVREKKKRVLCGLRLGNSMRQGFLLIWQRDVLTHRFLKEAHYSFKERTDGSYLYALAYPNDIGGYELRSEQFKGGNSPKGITTHINKTNASCDVFEGFMDMLSFATLCKDIKHNYVVLNSIVNVPSAIEALKEYPGTIYLCLDNDDGGSMATKQLLDAIPSAIDIRARFAPWKDLNDYLMHKE